MAIRAPALLLACLQAFLLLQCDPDCFADGLPRTKAVRVKTLTDANFEHDTQAATGQTTGRWLVLFKSEDLDSSEFENADEDGAGEDEEVGEGASSDRATSRPLSAEELTHAMMQIASEQGTREFLPAVVIVDKCPGLKQRFNISRTPTVKLFRDRKMFSFPGVPASAEELQSFLEGGYAAHGAPVPRERTFWDEQRENLGQIYKDFMGNPMAMIVAAIVCHILALLAYAFLPAVSGKDKTVTEKDIAREIRGGAPRSKGRKK